MRDTVWHLADERSLVTNAAHDAKEACEVTAELRASFSELAMEVRSELAIEVRKQQDSLGAAADARDARDAKLLQSMQESSLETRYEEQSLRELETQFEEHSRAFEGRFQEHNGLLNQRLEEHSRTLEGRFQEHNGLLNQRLEEHSRTLEGRLQEHNGLLNQRLEEHSRTLEGRFQEHNGLLNQRLEEHTRGLEEHHHTLEERFQEIHEKMSSFGESMREDVQPRQQVWRGNVIRDISARLAEEVAERACQSVTPVLERIMREAAEARDDRPATSPAVLEGTTHEPLMQGKHVVTDADETQVVATEVAKELIQLILTDWRNTPSPQEL